MGVISNSDFGDANDNWIYDKYPTTENATTNLNLYAKWTPLKTHIILDASGASNGTNGEAWVEYDNTTLTSFTSVVPALSTTTTVLGYFTEPDCHGGNNGVMVLTSTGDFVVDTTTTSAPYKYFRTADSKNKWYKYNTQNEDTPLEIKLYAHYVVDTTPEIKAPTDVYVDYTVGDHPVNGTSYENINVAYGTTKTNINPPTSMLTDDEFMGLYADITGTIQVAYNDGRLVDGNVAGFVENGKWICQQPNVTLYAKWSMKIPSSALKISFMANGGKGYMASQIITCNGSTVALDANKYTNTGKTLVGWNTKADGTGTWYGDKYTYSGWKAGTMILYAQWGSATASMFMPVNYVRSDGASYINLGLKGQADSSLETSVCWNSVAADSFVVGSRNDTGNTRFYYLANSVNSRDYAGVGTYVAGTGPAVVAGKVYNYVTVIDSSYGVTVKRNGAVSYTKAGTALTATFDLYMFAYNKAGVAANMSLLDAYYLRLKFGSTLKLDFVPCRLTAAITDANKSTYAADGNTHVVGEVGFWDLVSNKFYANAGTGSLTCELN